MIILRIREVQGGQGGAELVRGLTPHAPQNDRAGPGHRAPRKVEVEEWTKSVTDP